MKRNIFTFLALFFIVLTTYFPTLFNDFCLDDAVIFTVPSTADFSAASKLLWQSTPHRLVDHYRPITFFSFTCDYFLWKKNAAGYHFSNILLMFCCCSCLFLFLQLFFARSSAFLACIIFAVHPGYSEAVIHVYNRSQILCTIMMISALFFTVKALEDTSRTKIFMSGLCTFMACLCKESGMVIPLFLPLLILYSRERQYRWSYWGYLLFVQLLGCLCYLLLRFHALESFVLPGTEGFLSSENLYIQYQNICRIYGEYLYLALWPVNLSCDYSFAVVDFHFLSLLLPIIAIAGLWLLYCGSFAWRSFALALGFFSISLLPVLHIVPIPVILGERFLFCCGIGMALFMATICEIFDCKKGIVVISLVLCMMTFSRSYDWQDNLTLWRKTLRNNRDSYRAQIFFGSYHLRSGNHSQAVRYFRKALQENLNKNNRALVYYNLGMMYFLQKSSERMNYYMQSVLKIYPHYLPAWLLLAQNAFSYKNYRKAQYYYHKFMKYENKNKYRWTFDYGAIYARIGNSFFYDKEWKKACFYYEKAMEYSNINIELLLNIAYGYLLQNQYEKSEQYLFQAQKQDSNHYQVYYLLAMLYYKTNQKQKFQLYYDKAKILKPVDVKLPTAK